MRAISVVKRAAHHFNSRVRGAALLGNIGLYPPRVTALGGFFLGVAGVHGSSVIFLTKKGITNAAELFASVRKAQSFSAIGVQWIV